MGIDVAGALTTPPAPPAPPAPRSPLDDLTPREREVLSLMAGGKSNSAIAHDLTLTKQAVEKHIGSIFMKLMLDDEEIVSRPVAAVLVFHDRQGDVATIGRND